MARKKCVLIGHVSAFQEVFQNFADLSHGDIEIIKRIGDISNKTDEEILVELDLCAGVDIVVIEPFLCRNKSWVNRTSLISKIRHLFPQSYIIATAIDKEFAPDCYDHDVNMFLEHEQISASKLIWLTSILINPESRPSLTFTHLRLVPKGYRIELTGKTKAGKIVEASVSLSSAPAMRQMYFLSVARHLNQAGWWKLIENREYLCSQRPLWDMLEIAIPRKPRGHICSGWVICSLLKEAFELVTDNGPSLETHSNDLRKAPLIKHANELSQMACHVNTPAKDAFSHYQCENIIVGPSKLHIGYELNESILAKNISFDLQNQ